MNQRPGKRVRARATIGRDVWSFVSVWLAAAEGRLAADVALAYTRPENWKRKVRRNRDASRVHR